MDCAGNAGTPVLYVYLYHLRRGMLYLRMGIVQAADKTAHLLLDLAGCQYRIAGRRL